MDSKITIRNATTGDIDSIIELAGKIWPATYQPILSSDQIHYMMNLFYSADSLRDQMLVQKHSFLILESAGLPSGFASYSKIGGHAEYKLHKIYVLPGLQGQGLGKILLNHILDLLKKQGAFKLVLNVNRYNKARQFYERMGFTVIREEDFDIGNQYFMNDFVMELRI